MTSRYPTSFSTMITTTLKVPFQEQKFQTSTDHTSCSRSDRRAFGLLSGSQIYILQRAEIEVLTVITYPSEHQLTLQAWARSLSASSVCKWSSGFTQALSLSWADQQSVKGGGRRRRRKRRVRIALWSRESEWMREREDCWRTLWLLVRVRGPYLCIFIQVWEEEERVEDAGRAAFTAGPFDHPPWAS